MSITSGQSYLVGLIIGEQDYSADLVDVTIISSLASYYPVITLKFNTDPDNVILNNKLYGQEYITLIIVLQGWDGEGLIPEYQTLMFELMHLNDNLDLPIKTMIMKDNDNERVPTPRTVEITTICRKPFKTISTLVNDVQTNIPIDVLIKGIISENTTAILEMDEEGINAFPLDQVCIPPSTVGNMFKYLDSTFGIYNGVSSIFCNHTNTLQVFNLTNRMKKDVVFTIHQLASDGDNEKLTSKGLNPKVFYTMAEVKTDYKANSKFSVYARTLKYVVKPKDTLSYTIVNDLKGIAKDYGLIDFTHPTSDPEFFLDEIITDKRMHYYTDQTGNDYSPVFINANHSKPLSNLFTLKIGLARSMFLTNLLRIGEPVKFDTEIVDYRRFTGKYILTSSVLTFTKENYDWSAGCFVTLARTNKSILN